MEDTDTIINNQKRDSIFSQCRDDQTKAAREWFSNGCKIVGYMSNNVPVELIQAAGLFPFQLPGSFNETNELSGKYMERIFDPMVQSVFNRILKGDFDFVDLIVLPRTSDSFQRMYYYLLELKRRGAEYSIPDVYLFDLLSTPWYTSSKYNYDSVMDLKGKLERVSNRQINKEDISLSITRQNKVRSNLREISAMRARKPALISGVSALDIYSASLFMDTEDFNHELDLYLNQDHPEINHGNKRIVIAGNALDHTALHELIESMGATVVGDYHWMGDLLFRGTVHEGEEPLRALTNYYHKSWSSRKYPGNHSELTEFAKEVQADGVVFYLFQEEEALIWDHPKQKDILDESGIPSLCLNNQPYRIEPTIITDEVRQFMTRL